MWFLLIPLTNFRNSQHGEFTLRKLHNVHNCFIKLALTLPILIHFIRASLYKSYRVFCVLRSDLLVVSKSQYLSYKTHRRFSFDFYYRQKIICFPPAMGWRLHTDHYTDIQLPADANSFYSYKIFYSYKNRYSKISLRWTLWKANNVLVTANFVVIIKIFIR